MKTIQYCFFALTCILASVAHAEDYSASIQFTHKVVLSVPVSGEVSSVSFNKGEQFKAGETLLALNSIPFEAAVQQARAQLSKKQALQREADRDHQHLVELFDRGVLSKVELEDAELKLTRATADRDSAQAKLTQAQYNLEHSKIKAPFDGIVLDVRVRAHESVNNAVNVMPLITIAKTNKYTATVLLPLSVTNSVKNAGKVKVSVGKSNYTGSVSGIAFEPHDASSKEKLYEVNVNFDSEGRLIRAGQSAKLNF